jgi:two-component system response regulator HydG
MLTADTGVPKAVRAIQVGAWDYLTKPVDRTRLVAAVRDALDQNAHTRRLRSSTATATTGPGGIIGSAPSMVRVFRHLERAAASDVTVLVTGESGTGKELVARAIHSQSTRRDRPFVAINCAAIPETLQETELFGHEKGAFTGAAGRRTGRFEQADKGTLFLDEVGELSFGLQAKLLRVLQERRFYRVGGNEEIEVDVRIVCATNDELHQLVRKGRFRKDLFYRLAVFELDIPPVRERVDDVVLLAQHFLADFAARHGRPRAHFSADAMRALQEYAWPGNVREIQNAVEAALVRSLGDEIVPDDLPRRIREAVLGGATPVPTPEARARRAPRPRTPSTAEDSERRLIEDAINENRGRLTEVVKQLGIPRTTLYRKRKKYKIGRP